MAGGSHGQAGCGQQAGGGGVQAASLVPSPMEDLFKQVKFYIVGDVDPEVVRLLRAGSAKEVSYNALATHIVTSEAEHTDVSEAREVFDLPVVKVLQSMSVPTRALDLRPSEARSLESSYLNTRDQDSVPSQPRDCITEPPPACHLLGCIFAFADYPERVLDKQLIGTWKKVIHQNGGLVDSVLSPRCTHLLCESQTSATFKQALREGKRCVTIHWLNDILKHGHVAPYRALHLPTAFAPEAR
uniref:BRCT domain-containing protein n=1 Tax=Eptatretus burgeri TaxID=7764 RepID=A0A8C4QTU9_EPTBU